MRISNLLRYGVTSVAALAFVAAGWWTRDAWRPWLNLAAPATSASTPSAELPHDHDHADRVKLSPQAVANLKLVVEPISPETFWRTISLPGTIADRPGQSDRGVTAPVAGVITAVHAQPGDTVKVGDALFTMRVNSELVHNTQAELFKATRDIQLNREMLDRLSGAGRGAVVPEVKLVDLEQQERRFRAAVLGYRQELLTRGFTPEQIESAAQGKFVTEVVVAAPPQTKDARELVTTASRGSVANPLSGSSLAYEVKDLRVQLGEQVQAGQVLSFLANHQLLYIEGRAFKQEAAGLERAAQNGWTVKAEFAEDDASAWPPLDQSFQIRYLANTVDPASRTFAFFLPLVNQSRSYEREGQTFLVWRFRPGQRVRLKAPIEEIPDVFVLPAEAVVKDGADVYAFRQNGDYFERKPVHIVYQDRDSAVIANDGSLGAGQYVVRNSAAALNRIVKALSSGGEEGHGHGHAGHSHDH